MARSEQGTDSVHTFSVEKSAKKGFFSWFSLIFNKNLERFQLIFYLFSFSKYVVNGEICQL